MKHALPSSGETRVRAFPYKLVPTDGVKLRRRMLLTFELDS